MLPSCWPAARSRLRCPHHSEPADAPLCGPQLGCCGSWAGLSCLERMFALFDEEDKSLSKWGHNWGNTIMTDSNLWFSAVIHNARMDTIGSFIFLHVQLSAKNPKKNPPHKRWPKKINRDNHFLLSMKEQKSTVNIRKAAGWYKACDAPVNGWFKKQTVNYS